MLHRAVRVTLACCVGFYTCRFLIGDAQMGTYACFAAMSLGAMSSIAGTARQRLRLYAVALLGSWIFVTAGTFAAVNVWVASARMHVVGFLVRTSPSADRALPVSPPVCCSCSSCRAFPRTPLKPWIAG